MPYQSGKPAAYKPQKKASISLDGWPGGWNNVFNPTELKDNELYETINVMLTGSGSVTPRWGSTDYFLAGSGLLREVNAYYDPSTSQNDLLAVTDSGYLVKKSGASYAIITGASFASGYDVSSTQIGGYQYIVGGNREMSRYDGTNLINFATVAKPTNAAASNYSGVSGTLTYSWRISALTSVGETLASDNVELVNLPQDLANTQIHVSWSATSAASGVLQGYSIYRGRPGGETYIGSVDENTTKFIDYGEPQSDTVFPMVSDTTGGPKCKHILKLDDRIVCSGFDSDPSLVMISARYPYESRFNWADGGGYVRVGPDDGDKVVCTAVVGSNVKGGSVPATILVFKERATYAMVLKTLTIGNYVVLDPQYQQLLAVGTKSPRSVVRVENDVFFLTTDGIYSVGSEPNFLNEIRSRAVSTRIRGYIDGLSDSDFAEATADYMDSKYLLSFPSRKETIVYDYEKRAFYGPWKTPFKINDWFKYYDSNGNEIWLAGADSGVVKQFSPSLKSDSGVAYSKRAKTKTFDFGDWTIMKIVELFYILFRSVRGTVNVTVLGENRKGETVGIKTFPIVGSSLGASGYGVVGYGVKPYGVGLNAVNVVSDDFVRWSQLYKTVRVSSIEVSSNGVSDNWEWIVARLTAQPLGTGSLSPQTRT